MDSIVDGRVWLPHGLFQPKSSVRAWVNQVQLSSSCSRARSWALALTSNSLFAISSTLQPRSAASDAASGKRLVQGIPAFAWLQQGACYRNRTLRTLYTETRRRYVAERYGRNPTLRAVIGRCL